MTTDDVYRADDMAVQRRIGDGSYVTIARGNTPDITSYIATALNASAADGRAAHTQPDAPPDLIVEWLNDDGTHLPDCSLPPRHESFCQPGGAGHPAAPQVRGYWPAATQRTQEG